MSRLSFLDVLAYAVDMGLGYADAEALADRLCPEYNMTTRERMVREVAKVMP